MREYEIWKRFIWEWRYWFAMALLASPVILHILFPELLPDWLVNILAFMLDSY